MGGDEGEGRYLRWVGYPVCFQVKRINSQTNQDTKYTFQPSPTQSNKKTSSKNTHIQATHKPPSSWETNPQPSHPQPPPPPPQLQHHAHAPSQNQPSTPKTQTHP